MPLGMRSVQRLEERSDMKTVEVVEATEGTEASSEATLAIEVAIRRTSEEVRNGKIDLAIMQEGRGSMEVINNLRVLKKVEMQTTKILTTILA